MISEKVLHENVAPHSVTLSTNAKGKVQIEVKVYSDSPAFAAREALHLLADIKKELGSDAAGAES